jgi:hypothetical protein
MPLCSIPVRFVIPLLIAPCPQILVPGTAYVWMAGTVVKWLYGALCGRQDGFFWGNDAFYVTDIGRARLSGSIIRFHFGEHQVSVDARMLAGVYSSTRRGFFGTIQAKGAGSALEERPWTFDIFGTVCRPIFTASPRLPVFMTPGILQICVDCVRCSPSAPFDRYLWNHKRRA